MNVNVTGAYIYFEIPIFGGIAVTQTDLSLLVVTILLSLAAYFLGRDLKKRPGGAQVLVEKAVTTLRNLVSDTMGPHNVGWTPYIGTVFLSSICGSLIGMLGIFRSATADLSVPLTWAVMTSVIIWYNSIKRNGFLGWLKGFTEPVVVMTPMNLISEVAQPVSMAFRHFGNVAGGGVITSILYTALGLASTALLNLVSSTIVVPIVVLALGVLLFVLGKKQKKTVRWVFGIVFFVIGVLGLLQYTFRCADPAVRHSRRAFGLFRPVLRLCPGLCVLPFEHGLHRRCLPASRGSGPGLTLSEILKFQIHKSTLGGISLWNTQF